MMTGGLFPVAPVPDHEPTTVLELTRDKHEGAWELYDADEAEWNALTAAQQAQRLTDGTRARRIAQVAVLGAERHIMHNYEQEVYNLNLMWDLWSRGKETPQTREIRLALIRKLDAIRLMQERAIVYRIETRSAKARERQAGVVANAHETEAA